MSDPYQLQLLEDLRREATADVERDARANFWRAARAYFVIALLLGLFVWGVAGRFHGLR